MARRPSSGRIPHCPLAHGTMISTLLLGGLIGLSSFPALQAQTGGSIVFGPEVFVRRTGEPVTETRVVDPTGFDPPFTMYVLNGDENGENRISSAKLWLDGHLLLGSSDFSQQVEGFAIPVGLAGTSLLETRLVSTPGSHLTVWIEGQSSQNLEIVPDELHAVTKVVTPEGGGLLTTTGFDGTEFSLEIPAGSVQQSESITLTPLRAIEGLPSQIQFAAGAQLQPDELTLLGSAVLSIKPSVGTLVDDLLGFMYHGTGSDFHLYPTITTEDSLDFLLPGFSNVGLAEIPCSELLLMGETAAGGAIAKAKHAIAILDENVDRCLDDPTIDLAESYTTLYHYWFSGEGGVWDQLFEAEAALGDYITEAISAFEDWYAAQLHEAWNDSSLPFPPFSCGLDSPCTDLADLEEAGKKAIGRALEAAVVSANENCAARGDQDDSEALRWIEIAIERLETGIYDDPEDLDIESYVNLKTCGIWSISVSPWPVSGEVSTCGTLALEVVLENIRGEELGGRSDFFQVDESAPDWVGKVIRTNLGPTWAFFKGVTEGITEIKVWHSLLYGGFVNIERFRTRVQVEVLSCIYRIDWSISFDGQTECTWEQEDQVFGDSRKTTTESYTGQWSGSTAIEYPNEWDQEMVFFSSEGLLEYQENFEFSKECIYLGDPPPWRTVYTNRHTQYAPETACLESEPYISFNEDGSLMFFNLGCEMDAHHTWYTTGMDCHVDATDSGESQWRSCPPLGCPVVELRVDEDTNTVYSLDEVVTIQRPSPCSNFPAYPITYRREFRAVAE